MFFDSEKDRQLHRLERIISIAEDALEPDHTHRAAPKSAVLSPALNHIVTRENAQLAQFHKDAIALHKEIKERNELAAAGMSDDLVQKAHAIREKMAELSSKADRLAGMHSAAIGETIQGLLEDLKSFDRRVPKAESPEGRIKLNIPSVRKRPKADMAELPEVLLPLPMQEQVIEDRIRVIAASLGVLKEVANDISDELHAQEGDINARNDELAQIDDSIGVLYERARELRHGAGRGLGKLTLVVGVLMGVSVILLIVAGFIGATKVIKEAIFVSKHQYVSEEVEDDVSERKKMNDERMADSSALQYYAEIIRSQKHSKGEELLSLLLNLPLSTTNEG
ncbi:hypothetical protein J8273_0070 [Carpediemonas membranifera]|uniref:t-SNARE coiled-coil homology domain-containing protein n=1 Tax=Carpediemonas membranifera TaxID=201153 RepID=A0A8J6B3D7_9EUKA|nr:hypothetical protein J8273_0070 [Carpediemonas membranifera]|eukprot:KAG9394863.1 hypothetical protein J8273_0070 [Carpediemonas membranifera]